MYTENGLVEVIITPYKSANPLSLVLLFRSFPERATLSWTRLAEHISEASLDVADSMLSGYETAEKIGHIRTSPQFQSATWTPRIRENCSTQYSFRIFLAS